jgi:hypothetical protein
MTGSAMACLAFMVPGTFIVLTIVKRGMSIDERERYLGEGWMELGVLTKSRNETLPVLDAVKPSELIRGGYDQLVSITTYRTNPYADGLSSR